MSKPPDIAAKVRAMCEANSSLQPLMEKHWNLVCDKIQQHALAARRKRRVFEVHHESEVARGAFLTAIGNGRTPHMAEADALNAIGLE